MFVCFITSLVKECCNFRKRTEKQTTVGVAKRFQVKKGATKSTHKEEKEQSNLTTKSHSTVNPQCDANPKSREVVGAGGEGKQSDNLCCHQKPL